jgi:hypothetical protein
MSTIALFAVCISFSVIVFCVTRAKKSSEIDAYEDDEELTKWIKDWEKKYGKVESELN